MPETTLTSAVDGFQSVRSSLYRSGKPAVEPVSVSELKAHLRIDSGDEDGLLASYIAAARELLEQDAELSLCQQTWVLRMDRFPSWEIHLRRPPVQSVTSIQYVDSAGSTQTVSSSDYVVDIYSTPPRVYPAYADNWPSPRGSENDVTVTFVAGSASIVDVPQAAKQAIMMLAGHWFRNRDAISQAMTYDVKLSYDALLSRLKWGGYA